MATLTAFVLLVVTALTFVAALWAGRWVAGRAFGRRSIVDAAKPWSDVGYPMALARAVGGTVGWYLGASLLVVVALLLSGEDRLDEGSMRVRVIPGGPAARAGLLDGDRIVAVDGAPVRDWPELVAATAAHDRTVTRVEVARGGATVAFDVMPEGGKIRVGPPSEHVDVGFGAAIARGIKEPGRVVAKTIKTVAGVFGGERAEMTGAVGVGKVMVIAERERAGRSLRLDAALGAEVLPLIFILSVALVIAARRPR